MPLVWSQLFFSQIKRHSKFRYFNFGLLALYIRFSLFLLRSIKLAHTFYVYPSIQKESAIIYLFKGGGCNLFAYLFFRHILFRIIKLCWSKVFKKSLPIHQLLRQEPRSSKHSQLSMLKLFRYHNFKLFWVFGSDFKRIKTNIPRVVCISHQTKLVNRNIFVFNICRVRSDSSAAPIAMTRSWCSGLYIANQDVSHNINFGTLRMNLLCPSGFMKLIFLLVWITNRGTIVR